MSSDTTTTRRRPDGNAIGWMSGTAPARKLRQPTIRLHKSGLWEVRWRPDPLTRKSAYARTRAEAQQLANQKLAEQLAGVESPARRYTLASWLPTWLDARSGIAPRTRQRYAVEIRRWTADKLLARHKLADLRAEHIGAALRRMEDAGLTPTARKNALAILRLALDDALDSGHLIRNPARAVRAPRAVVRQIAPPRGADLDRLRAAMADDADLEALWMLALHAGLRQGELLGLRWCDVNTSTGQVHVRGSLINGTTTRGDTKTHRHRVVRIDAERAGADLPAIIERHRDRQLARGILATGTAYVFCEPDGSPIVSRKLYDRWTRLCLVARIGAYRFHDLRHAAATDLLTRADVVSVSRQLGHSQLAMTNRYLHPELADAPWQEPDQTGHVGTGRVLDRPYPRSADRFTPDPYPRSVDA